MARKGTVCKTITLPNGTRKWVYGKTKKEVEEKMRELNHLVYLGVDVANTQTFGEYVKQWFETYKVGKVRDTTLRTYRTTINASILPYLSGYKMRDITSAHIQALFNANSHKAEKTLDDVRTMLEMIFSTAVAEGVIIRDPISKSIITGGKKKAKRTALTPEQTDTLLENLHDRIDYLRCVILLNTGMRIGEATGLPWTNVNFEKWEVKIDRTLGYDNHGRYEWRDPKTDRGYRTIPVNKACIEALREMKRYSTGLYVFAGKSGTNPITNSEAITFRKHLKAAARDDAVTFHVLRHTYCTRLFDEGKLRIDDISYLMGHADVTVTLRIYAHYQAELRLQEVENKIRCS